jgi:ATP-binding cassette, subfamily B, bacterial HlyB/CyaB
MLSTPLFTQAIIDKVVVHRTESTLIAISVAMAIFVVFSALLSWVRQYLVLHTGNRVDAVPGAAVRAHLLKLLSRYYEYRSNGVVAARLHWLETIREFVSGAAVSLVLDLPFLVICLGVMLYYSVSLTALAVAILGLIAIASFFIAPIFQKRLNEQFLMGARNQAYSLVPKRQQQGKGAIDIDSLAFRYRDDSPILFASLSLQVEVGQAVAIMRPSGTGKSTFAKLLQGFYEPTAGSIRIDGVDIRYLSANELRSFFGVVPQETILFSGSILENLLAANPSAAFEQVQMSCKLAGIHETIEALPQGYATEIGERGSGLSGGQKQRLAIARALLKRPKILVFDEATSALDKDTAESFAATVNQLKGKVTMLFITHGLPRNLKVDAVLNIGKAGSHEYKLVQSLASTAKTESH